MKAVSLRKTAEKIENSWKFRFLIFSKKKKFFEKIEEKIEKNVQIVLTKRMRDGALYPLGV